MVIKGNKMQGHTKSKAERFFAATFGGAIPIILSGILRAVGIYIFVSPNSFAPGGINGIAVLLEYGTGFNSGWFLLALNVPLFFVAFFVLGKRQAVISTLSMVLTSGLLIVCDYIPSIAELRYIAADGGRGILAAIASGVFLGGALAVMLKSCGTSGGTTVIASMVNKKWRNLSVSWLTSALDALVVAVSFFVFHRGESFTAKLDPVLLALVSLFSTSRICDVILNGFNEAYRFEIVTNHAEELSRKIMERTRHGVTKLAGVGMFSHSGNEVLVCVIRKRQIAEVQKIIKSYPETFASFTKVSRVYGRFVK